MSWSLGGKKNKIYTKENKMNFSRLVTVIISWLFISLMISAQEAQIISIETCYKRAIHAYPVYKNMSLIAEEGELRAQNQKNAYLPSMYFQAEAKYLSEVINLNSVLPIPGFDIPSPPNEQFNFSINLNQLIYDGGMIKKSVELERNKSLIDEQSLIVDLYQIRERVNTIYFSILFLQQNDSLFKLSLQELDERLQFAESAVKNGILLQSDLDIMMAEMIGLEQNVLENGHNISQGIKVLEILIDSSLSIKTKLERPTVLLDIEAPISRPELALFQFQGNNLDLNKQLISATRRPMLSGFGQLGYGQPGLNPVNDSFDTYYILGLRLTWNIWDWNKAGREKEILQLNQQKIIHLRETFEYNLSLELQKEKEEILKFEELIQKDHEIIYLRKNILNTSSSRLDNGIIQSTDYVRNFNQYLAAMVKLNIHELMLLKSKFNYLTAQGNTMGDQ